MNIDRTDRELASTTNEYACRLADWLGTARRQKWIVSAIYLLLAVNLFTLGLYLFHGYLNYFHTDSSTKNLLAQEMWETGQFFPSDWNYANRDLMVVFGQVLIWPLLAFFKNGFALHAISGLLLSAAMLAAVWKLAGLLCETRWQRVMVVTVLAGGVSMKTAENIFGQAAYGTILFLSLIVILLGWWVMQARGRRLHLALAVLGLVFFLATWSNPQRALISYVAPVFVAIGIQVLWGGSMVELSMRFRRGVLACLAGGAGIAMGVVSSAWVISGVQNSNKVAAARWLDYDGFVSNLIHSAQAVMAMFGGVPAPGGEVVTMDGAYAALRLIVAFILLFLVPWSLVLALRTGKPVLRFFASFIAVQLSATMLLFVTTTIPDMSDPMTSGRYLAPPILLGLILLFSLSLSRERPAWSTTVVGLMFVLATNSVIRLGNEAMPVRFHNAERIAVIDALRANKLQYGYASYWNSGANSVMSDGDSLVRQIVIVDGLPLPMRHLGSNRWYEPDAWKGSTFLLLDKSEEAKVNWDAMRTRTGVDPERVQVGSLTAFVYPMNIAEKMPLWSRSFEHAVSLPAVAEGMRNQGSWDEREKAILSRKGEAGFLAFGPYMYLPAGRYRAEFQVESTGAAEGVEAAIVDVAYGGGSNVISSLQIKSSSVQEHSVEFELDKPVDSIELRTRATGEAQITYRGVILQPLGRDKKSSN